MGACASRKKKKKDTRKTVLNNRQSLQATPRLTNSDYDFVLNRNSINASRAELSQVHEEDDSDFYEDIAFRSTEGETEAKQTFSITATNTSCNEPQNKQLHTNLSHQNNAVVSSGDGYHERRKTVATHCPDIIGEASVLLGKNINEESWNENHDVYENADSGNEPVQSFSVTKTPCNEPQQKQLNTNLSQQNTAVVSSENGYLEGGKPVATNRPYRIGRAPVLWGTNFSEETWDGNNEVYEDVDSGNKRGQSFKDTVTDGLETCTNSETSSFVLISSYGKADISQNLTDSEGADGPPNEFDQKAYQDSKLSHPHSAVCSDAVYEYPKHCTQRTGPQASTFSFEEEEYTWKDIEYMEQDKYISPYYFIGEEHRVSAAKDYLRNSEEYAWKDTDSDNYLTSDSRSCTVMVKNTFESSETNKNVSKPSFQKAYVTTDKLLDLTEPKAPDAFVEQRTDLLSDLTKQSTTGRLKVVTREATRSIEAFPKVPTLQNSEDTIQGKEIHEIEEAVKINRTHIIERITVHQILPHLYPFIISSEIERIRLLSQQNNTNAAEQLLELIESSDEPGKWQMLAEALNETGHISAVQIMKRQAIPDTTEKVRILRLVSPRLREMIVPHEIIPALKARGLITSMDEEEIMAKERSHGNTCAADHLLQCVPRKHPSWYKSFLEAIADRSELLDILGCGTDNVSHSFQSVHHIPISPDEKVHKENDCAEMQHVAELTETFLKEGTEQSSTLQLPHMHESCIETQRKQECRGCRSGYAEKRVEAYVVKRRKEFEELELLQKENRDLENECNLLEQRNDLLRKNRELKEKIKIREKEGESLKYALQNHDNDGHGNQSTSADNVDCEYEATSTSECMKNGQSPEYRDGELRSTEESTDALMFGHHGTVLTRFHSTSRRTIFDTNVYGISALDRYGFLLLEPTVNNSDFRKLYDVDMTYQDSAFYSDFGG